MKKSLLLLTALAIISCSNDDTLDTDACGCKDYPIKTYDRDPQGYQL